MFTGYKKYHVTSEEKNPTSLDDPLDGNAFEKWRTSQVYHFGKMYKMNGTSDSGFKLPR